MFIEKNKTMCFGKSESEFKKEKNSLWILEVYSTLLQGKKMGKWKEKIGSLYLICILCKQVSDGLRQNKKLLSTLLFYRFLWQTLTVH